MKTDPLTPIECVQVRNLLKTIDAATRNATIGFSISGTPVNPRQKPFSQSDVRAAMNECAPDNSADAYNGVLSWNTGTFKIGQSEYVFEPSAHRKTLICMIGLPRAGKSSHALDQNCPVVAPDAIRLALHGQRFIAQMEPIVWQTAQTMVKALFNAGHNRVILDACNVTREHRAQWIKPGQWKTEFHHITTPVEMCLERADRAGDTEIVPVIKRMNVQWEPIGELIREHKFLLFNARGEAIADYPTPWVS